MIEYQIQCKWSPCYSLVPVRFDCYLKTLRLRQNGRYFPDDIFKWIFFNENVWISINISLKFVPRGPINNIPTLVQVMAWCRPGDKPLSELMMVRLPTHICVTRPQWVKLVICKLLSRLDILSIFCRIALRWMPQDLIDDKLTLVQFVAWCRLATSHYLNQCWSRSVSPYGCH